jgi:hypothetical protein
MMFSAWERHAEPAPGGLVATVLGFSIAAGLERQLSHKQSRTQQKMVLVARLWTVVIPSYDLEE